MRQNVQITKKSPSK